MPNNLVHFAVHADDLDRARRFYGSVFAWQFQGFGGSDKAVEASGGKVLMP